MIIDMHTHAGRPRRTGAADRAALATMKPAGVDRVGIGADLPAGA